MDKIKSMLDLVDAAVKIAIAAIGFLLFGVQKDQLVVEKSRAEIAQSQQSSSLVVAEKIIQLLFEEKNKCIAEDQAFLIDFLIETHNEYNKVKINKDQFNRTTSGRRSCGSGQVGSDLMAASALNAGAVPVVNSENVTKVIVESKDTKIRAQGGGVSTFAAIGSFDAVKQTFRNFKVLQGSTKDDGTVVSGALLQAKWTVYLRANTNDTTENSNPILGVLAEAACVQVMTAYPLVRGQTWADIRPVACPK